MSLTPTSGLARELGQTVRSSVEAALTPARTERSQAASGSLGNMTVQKPFDWTYTTLHPGSTRTPPSAQPAEWRAAPPTHPGIPLASLARTDIPILFFDEIPLFEDELGDNGIANVTVRVVRALSALLRGPSKSLTDCDGSASIANRSLSCRDSPSESTTSSSATTTSGPITRSGPARLSARSRAARHRTNSSEIDCADRAQQDGLRCLSRQRASLPYRPGPDTRPRRQALACPRCDLAAP